MFEKLERVAHVSTVFREEIPGSIEIESLHASLDNCTEIHAFNAWLTDGIRKTNPEASGNIDIFDEEKILVVGGTIKDEMLVDGGNLFAGIPVSYDLTTSTLRVLGRIGNHSEMIEIDFKPEGGFLRWDIFDNSK